MVYRPRSMASLSQAPRTPGGILEARPSDVEKHPEVLVIDVRAEGELLGPSGHIRGVTHVPMDTLLRDGLASLGAELPLEAPVILVCEAGMRSRTCAQSLVARGHLEVYTLVGGMRRWIGEERPVERTRTWK